MTEVFKKHKYDDMELYKSTQSVAACDCHFEEKEGKQIKVIDVPILTCECVWRRYQKEAEDIVAPGGKLIADPKERNKRINQAYAKIWLEDNRFQWAGLAAFASKQVGCGLMHASTVMKKVEAEHDAQKRLTKAMEEAKKEVDNPMFPGYPPFIIAGESADDVGQAIEETRKASKNNPVPADLPIGEKGLAYAAVSHVYEMMALGNTSLFLDVYPLHAFYKQRGLEELKTCLPVRKNIYGNSKFPVLWPIEQDELEFGLPHKEILKTFEAIDAGNIAKSVEYLAYHEQVNILQPSMYSNSSFVWALRSNHWTYISGFFAGASESVELTLTSQCVLVNDGRTIKFIDDWGLDLSNINSRMPFVLKAAARFNELLNGSNRGLIQKSIEEIAARGGDK
ncbi:hypothetical protein PSI22_20835 [Xenorhabdus sp. XENO-7]|uniref:Uncharacterized protein n=1 Tax=Xenorhabdus aichiensis TaxID=3025874 RepID=A0ABT5M944_9GAMM|nr:hypothetical protein [Xenorhabdus aichiensis]MDC9624006.1 hypothetical protein [Xenorhabdus aichiensis]